ncbi:hypothetical protein H4Q26_009427, partial [Puccinia striiformis f. sp. tritici PST-130]
MAPTARNVGRQLHHLDRRHQTVVLLPDLKITVKLDRKQLQHRSIRTTTSSPLTLTAQVKEAPKHSDEQEL